MRAGGRVRRGAPPDAACVRLHAKGATAKAFRSATASQARARHRLGT